MHAGAKGTRLTSSVRRNVRTLCCRWYDRGRIISKRCALISQKEPVTQERKSETCPGHRLDRGLKELDINICRFEPVPAKKRLPQMVSLQQQVVASTNRRQIGHLEYIRRSVSDPKAASTTFSVIEEANFIEYRSRIHDTLTILEQGGQCIEVASPLSMQA